MPYSILVGNKSVGMSVGVLCAWEQCLIGGVGKQVPYPDIQVATDYLSKNFTLWFHIESSILAKKGLKQIFFLLSHRSCCFLHLEPSSGSLNVLGSFPTSAFLHHLTLGCLPPESFSNSPLLSVIQISFQISNAQKVLLWISLLTLPLPHPTSSPYFIFFIEFSSLPEMTSFLYLFIAFLCLPHWNALGNPRACRLPPAASLAQWSTLEAQYYIA